MHCVHCGAEIPDYAKFCTVCGQPVAPAPEAPAQEPMDGEQPEGEATAEETTQATGDSYTPPVNASEGYKAANAQLPPSYSAPNYSQNSSAYSVPSQSPVNGLAIAGFVCSLIFLPVGLGALCAVAGLVLSIMGMNAAKKLPEKKGHGLALAGTIISAIRIALLIVGLVALLVLMVRGAGHVGHEFINNWQQYMPYTY